VRSAQDLPIRDPEHSTLVVPQLLESLAICALANSGINELLSFGLPQGGVALQSSDVEPGVIQLDGILKTGNGHEDFAHESYGTTHIKLDTGAEIDTKRTNPPLAISIFYNWVI